MGVRNLYEQIHKQQLEQMRSELTKYRELQQSNAQLAQLHTAKANAAGGVMTYLEDKIMVVEALLRTTKSNEPIADFPGADTGVQTVTAGKTSDADAGPLSGSFAPGNAIGLTTQGVLTPQLHVPDEQRWRIYEKWTHLDARNIEYSLRFAIDTRSGELGQAQFKYPNHHSDWIEVPVGVHRADVVQHLRDNFEQLEDAENYTCNPVPPLWPTGDH